MSSEARTITYSPSFTVVPTHECFNRCGYCNFRAEAGSDWLTPEAARQLLEPLRRTGVCEILVLSGEVHPRDRRRGDWFSMIESLCAVALELGFLPHTNCGILSFAEMRALQQVNCSMGLMLEIESDRLLESVHRHAPSKIPALRVEQLAWAGELGIPFTTGLLLGIGETWAEREATLQTIARLQERYGHIQEVILQPHRPGGAQHWSGEALGEAELLETVRLARSILPAEITLQIPPNLVVDLLPFLEAGVRDLGGIGPVDVVNPDYAHPLVARLRGNLQEAGWKLKERLPVYPHLYGRVPTALRQTLRTHLQSFLDSPILRKKK
ncbi:7,8-didemethyl-8-hydroxy-5-deazariboflavin synthase subunit CofG [Gloeobacter kilaueensis]|uniref:7,8-didemethyl-8-hydroxy-5-deazariboflavin synthase n=1 Tax=Gloeobacter kilaueensis (strain ATCC BAA-2537 / CCAP 1431/1 / ULC 316 / JS1) TaxID=1183438 RepID=U5QBP1_GLOK1|nr:7,8-didemethyl-8-hydroxy-5-deazariboflavin synthase subunit CofG [Gloeobacter kilaueensis]AGY56276.1 FO synthase subunit 1 [Gloeobacter kilaueensis JS1]